MKRRPPFVVGAEKRLTDIIGTAEVTPLLLGAVKAGAASAAVLAPEGDVLWEAGKPCNPAETKGSIPIVLEGEPAGSLVVSGNGAGGDAVKGIAAITHTAVQTLVNASLKRILTTEIHTSVVNQSYKELLEINKSLSASEARYRELAATLEKKVEERTAELQRAHTRLLQQEKMASIGQLAAGMAHEINNPLGFITSNIHSLQKYTARFILMLDYYSSLLASDPACERLARLSARKWEELKLDSICADIDDLIGQSLEGAERIRKIVSDLKGFSHVDDTSEGIVDLNAEIDRTLSVLEHRFPEGTDIVKNYRELPGFRCNPAVVCQLFVNIVENAIEARGKGLRLMISTFVNHTAITVSFADNGPGIPEDMRTRIFEPFFTTKEVGSGTGMGLAVVHEIVTGYEGTVEVTCPAAGGTIVTVSLPLQRKNDVALL
ncbi:MAG TPA: ATP-binding protein [Geobacteraceae bacterium]